MTCVVKEIGPQPPCTISSSFDQQEIISSPHFCTKIKFSFFLAMGIATSLIFNLLKQLPTVLLQSRLSWLQGILIKSSPTPACILSGIVRSYVAHQVIQCWNHKETSVRKNINVRESLFKHLHQLCKGTCSFLYLVPLLILTSAVWKSKLHSQKG